MARAKLHDDERALLEDEFGVIAFRLLLPLIREFALYFAGRDREPQLTDKRVADLKSESRVEAARCRLERKKSCE